MSLISLHEQDLWFRVFHPQFDPEKKYKAIALVDYHRCECAEFVFANEHGYVWFVPQNKCILVSALQPGFLSKPLYAWEKKANLPDPPPPSDEDSCSCGCGCVKGDGDGGTSGR